MPAQRLVCRLPKSLTVYANRCQKLRLPDMDVGDAGLPTGKER